MRLEYIAKVVGDLDTTTLTLVAAEACRVLEALRSDALDRVWRTDVERAGQTTEDAEVVEDAESSSSRRRRRGRP